MRRQRKRRTRGLCVSDYASGSTPRWLPDPRPSARELVDLASLEKRSLAFAGEQFIDASPGKASARASLGFIGETAEARGAFWTKVDTPEKPRQ